MKIKSLAAIISLAIVTAVSNVSIAAPLKQSNCEICNNLTFSDPAIASSNTNFSIRILEPEEELTSNVQKNEKIAQATDIGSVLANRKPLGWSTLDFSTPSSPGARIIGYKGEIGAVATPNELAVKLLTGLDSDGNGSFQTGLAIDIAPYLLIRGNGFTLAEYRDENSGLQRFLANTKISIATSKSDTTARLGIGFDFILNSSSDLRLDQELFDDLSNIFKNRPQPSPDDKVKLAEYDNLIKSDIQAVKKAARQRATQKPIWVLGVATSLISDTGRYFNFRGDGMGVWTTYKAGLGGDSELILHGSYRSGQRISDRNNNFFNGDTLTAGARIRTGSEDFKFSLETAYNLETQSSKTSNNYLSFGIGLEPKLSDNLWLSVSMDGATGRQNSTDFQVFSGVKWNFNNGNN